VKEKKRAVLEEREKRDEKKEAVAWLKRWGDRINVS
jgi:hypothetical protein